jgi:MFS transporter, OFA family, oxalate/formate antiporter
MPAAPERSRLIDRSPVFYGWVVLVLGTLGLVMTTPGQTLGVSVFLDPILDDLGAERGTVSLLYTIGTLAGAVALPFVGRALDRWGPRVMVTVVAAGLALACVWMANVRDLTSLAIGFVLIRGLGQGALGLVSVHAITIWFVRRRGLAIGLAGVGMAVATAFFPLLIETMVGAWGWRWAYAALGGLVAVTILPLGALFLRRDPERYGVTPDARDPLPPAPPGREEIHMSAGQARRTVAFWYIAVSVATISALSTGLVFHHFDLMSVRGMDRLAAAGVFVPMALVSAATNMLAGILLDRVAPRFVVSGMLVAMAASLAGATLVAEPTLWLYGAILGLTQGAMGAVSGTAYASYFGRRAIGGIKGTAQTLSVGGAAAGPLLLAWGQAATGSYEGVLFAAALWPLALAIGALFIPRPRRPGSADGPTKTASTKAPPSS